MWSNDRFSSISTTTWLTEPRPLPLVISPPFRNGRAVGIPAGAEPMVSPGAGPAGQNAAGGRSRYGFWW
jgi:hypothetical protein